MLIETYAVRTSVTEILDVAPIDLLNGMTKSLIDNVTPDFLPASVEIKALDIGFHWVSESGQGTNRLTSGMSIIPTVRDLHMQLSSCT